MKTLAIDFDGVIHAYSRGWQDGVVYDDPMPGAADALQRLHERYRLVVFTARDELDPVRAWLDRHGLARFIAEVTNGKPKAWAYVDDRGVRFGSWKQVLGLLDVLDRTDRWQPLLPEGDA